MRSDLYSVQTSIVAAKIQMSQRSYISALFTTKIAGLELLLSWPVWEPSDHGSFLVTSSSSVPPNETSVQDFGINKADWNPEFLYYKEVLILYVNSSFETKYVCHIWKEFWGFSLRLCKFFILFIFISFFIWMISFYLDFKRLKLLNILKIKLLEKV